MNMSSSTTGLVRLPERDARRRGNKPAPDRLIHQLTSDLASRLLFSRSSQSTQRTFLQKLAVFLLTYDISTIDHAC